MRLRLDLISGTPVSCQSGDASVRNSPITRRRRRRLRSDSLNRCMGTGSTPCDHVTTHDSMTPGDVCQPCRFSHRGAATTHGKRSRPRRPDSASRILHAHALKNKLWNFPIALFLLLFVITPVIAVEVAFQNCLSQDYQSNDPTLLQWEPLEARAVFNTQNSSHSLEVIVWGNVNGSFHNVTLPPPGDPYWTDDNKTEGKIIQNPEPDAANKATTLRRSVKILNFVAWDESVDFCLSGLASAGNLTCPLAPVFGSNLNITAYPSMNITHTFNSAYAFTTLNPTFSIIYGDQKKTQIGCISLSITPDLGNISQVIRFLPLAVLILVGFATVFAAVWSPWGTTDIFHWTSNYGRDADLLRLVTPGFGDCLQHIQFMVLTGSLSLAYPGFYQPIVSQMSWASLIFNHTFATNSEPWPSIRDGMYVVNGTYGMERTGQLVGLSQPGDIWPGMMVWLCVLVAVSFVLAQAAFLLQWAYRQIRGTHEEDLRSKNIPFSIGNVVRIVYNYFLLPTISLSCFQLAEASNSKPFTVGLAVVTIVVLLVFSIWLLWFIIRTRPKSFLFDDLPTVLRYGPLYNTYEDHSASFALIPVLLTFIRGIAIGAVQPSGIAQVVLLAICEVIHILSLHAFRPFNPQTSMNAYHTIFSSLRLITIMLMVAFVPPLGVGDDSKGWIGYTILLIHTLVLLVGYFINALQTIVEVLALMLGAGGDDDRGLTRGGLSKIFGMRQLSRRPGPRPGPSRASQLSSAAMLDPEEGNKHGYAMPSGRLRSESAGSLSGIVANNRYRDSSVLDSGDMGYHRPGGSVSSYMPGTPGGDASTFSFANSPTLGRGQNPAVPMEAAGPFYRPPRRRNDTMDSDQADSQHESPVRSPTKRQTQPPGAVLGDPAEMGAEISRGATPAVGTANPANFLPNRPDYSTREVDLYYGVTRGPALNSDGAGRRLGTGPADPTGPVATASGWLRSMFGGKTKEKGKGFEVVRSARMPPGMMARNAEYGAEPPPEGIPVAMGVLRNGPIDSDDDEPGPKAKTKARPGALLTETGEPRGPEEDEPDSPVTDRLPRGSMPPERSDQNPIEEPPDVPRKSSKRHSALLANSGAASGAASGASSTNTQNPESRPRTGEEQAQATRNNDLRNSQFSLSRLPFERTASQKRRLSNPSSMEISIDLSREPSLRRGERPASFGLVSQHSISRVDPQHAHDELFATSAELVEEPLHDKRFK